jgi:uncharacterized protein
MVLFDDIGSYPYERVSTFKKVMGEAPCHVQNRFIYLDGCIIDMEIYLQLLLTFIVGIVASFVGAIIGAGGLISIPFLIFLGLPPQYAIATGRFASIGLNIVAIKQFFKHKQVIKRLILPFILIIPLSVVVSTLIVINLSSKFTENTIIALLIFSLIFFAVKKDVGVVTKKRDKKYEIVGYVILFVVTFFGSFIGGLGVLQYLVITYFFGLTMIQANATERVAWFVGVIISTIIFAVKGYINYLLGISLFFGFMVGGYLGVKTAIKKGNRWVRMLFLFLIVIYLIKFIFF